MPGNVLCKSFRCEVYLREYADFLWKLCQAFNCESDYVTAKRSDPTDKRSKDEQGGWT